MLPRAITRPIRVSINASKIINLPLGRKGQIIGRFGLIDYSNIGASCVLGNVLVLRVYSFMGLSAGASKVYRLCCNRP